MEMERAESLYIAVDAGHGGHDFGATFEGRMEKDDNLRLALAVWTQMEAQGVRVLMTRTEDVFVTLQDRASMANEADVDLFISLHRNSYIEQTPETNGVENYIYLTAPEESTGLAAATVLEEVVNVGVQRNRGVNRGNYYVLRRTVMPAMLLEMGFIINEIDNQLFDENLIQYAIAITKGAMRYFRVPFDPSRVVLPPPPPAPEPCPPEIPIIPIPPEIAPPPCTSGTTPATHTPVLAKPMFEAPVTAEMASSPASKRIMAAKKALNERYGQRLRVTGVYDMETRAAVVMSLQREMNLTYGAGLKLTGELDSETLAVLPSMYPGGPIGLVYMLQIMLTLNGYDTGAINGIYGSQTRSAVQAFQKDSYSVPNGIVEPKMVQKLLER